MSESEIYEIDWEAREKEERIEEYSDEIETLKLNIEILKDFIDDTVDEIHHHVGYDHYLYKLVDEMRYKLADKLH